MGHATPEELGDLADVLATVRSWPDVRETSPNVFYVRRTPFLHFHTKAGRRWADVRCGPAWGPQVEIAPGASARERADFLRAVERAYRETLGAMPKGRT